MGKFDWSYILTLISVVFGWFLNELSKWFGIKADDKKVRKEILYNLLETYDIFRKLDIQEAIDIMSDCVLRKLPTEAQTLEGKKALVQLYTESMTTAIKTNIEKRLFGIEVKYTTAVDSLAKIDPLMAYRLNGKTKILEVFELLREFTDDIGKAVSANVEDQEQFYDALNQIKPKIIKDSIKELQKEIVQISFSINILIWLKLKWRFQNIEAKMRQEMEAECDELFNKLVPAS